MAKFDDSDIAKADSGSDVDVQSCGYAKITYDVGPLLETLGDYFELQMRRETFLYVMNGFCDSYPALFEGENRGPHLIAYHEVDGKKYLKDAALIYSDDEEGALYVAAPEFLESTGLKKLARPIRHGRNDNGCFTPDPKVPIDSERRVLVDGRLCFAVGVYLTDIGREENHSSDGE